MQYIDGILIEANCAIPQMQRASGRWRLDTWLASRVYKYDQNATVYDTTKKPVPREKHRNISVKDCRRGGTVF